MALPVPIELIVEQQGIDIVPLPDLRRNFDVDGFASGDLTCIYVDHLVAEQYENRYRFTLAHELGHAVLHAQLFCEFRKGMPALQQWHDFHRCITEAGGGGLEYQANVFAGFVLVPPDRLRDAFHTALPQTRDLIRKAVEQGVRRDSVLEHAWEELCRRISCSFEVSGGVILRRLKTDGFSSDDL